MKILSIAGSGCYSYAVRNTHQSSAVFGSCEICNKPASEVWHQKRMLGRIVVSDGYGHKDCLERIQSRSVTASDYSERTVKG